MQLFGGDVRGVATYSSTNTLTYLYLQNIYLGATIRPRDDVEPFELLSVLFLAVYTVLPRSRSHGCHLMLAVV